MMLQKQIGAALLVLAMVSVAVLPAMAAVQPIQVEYNQQQIVFPDQKPIMQNDRTLVPLRPIAESLGFQVEWNEEARAVSIKKGNDRIRLVVSQKIARKNTEVVPLDVPTQIINNRTMVPVRFVAEALDYDVSWDPNRQTVMIRDVTGGALASQPSEQPVDAVPSAPQPDEQQQAEPTEQVILIDPETITATSFNLMGLGIYVIKGEIEPDTEVTATLDHHDFEARMKDDGTFVIEIADKIFVSEYTLTVVKDGKQQVIQGEFTEKKR